MSPTTPSPAPAGGSTTTPAAAAPGPAPAGTAAGPSLDPAVAARLRRTPDGLVAAVVQQHGTGEVLMLGWMDDEALALTLSTGRATYWSRSRHELWRKGDTSGHVQHVRSVALDCDGDALLVRVDQVGPACHTGTRTCFDGRDLAAVDAGDARAGAADGERGGPAEVPGGPAAGARSATGSGGAG